MKHSLLLLLLLFTFVFFSTPTTVNPLLPHPVQLKHGLWLSWKRCCFLSKLVIITFYHFGCNDITGKFKVRQLLRNNNVMAPSSGERASEAGGRLLPTTGRHAEAEALLEGATLCARREEQE